ncbi:MAG: hypothetical protein ACLP9L_41580 [Thermoguttaceae bacterium]
MHTTHHEPELLPIKRRRRGPERGGSWRFLKRTLRLALAHLALQLVSGQCWNALALAVMAALAAVPAEVLSAHCWLRSGIPVVLAAIGVLAHGVGNHPAVVDRCKQP